MRGVGDLARLRRLFFGRSDRQHLADEQVIEVDAQCAADKRADDRYPPVSVGREGGLAPAADPREQPGADVAGRVDGVAGVRAQRDADDDDGKSDPPPVAGARLVTLSFRKPSEAWLSGIQKHTRADLDSGFASCARAPE